MTKSTQQEQSSRLGEASSGSGVLNIGKVFNVADNVSSLLPALPSLPVMPDSMKNQLRWNAARIVGFLVIGATIPVQVKSILHNEFGANNQFYYDVSNALTPISKSFSVSARMVDYAKDPEARDNMIAGAFLLVCFLAQMGCALASIFSDYKQPIALPPVIGAVSGFLYVRLNWKSAKSQRENLGRIGGVVATAAALGCAIPALTSSNRAYFFANNACSSVSGFFDALNRLYDLFQADTHFIQKICIIVRVVAVVAVAVLSGLGAAGVWDQPLVFSSLINGVSGVLYDIAQWKTKEEEKEAQAPLLTGVINDMPRVIQMPPAVADDSEKRPCWVSVVMFFWRRNMPQSPEPQLSPLPPYVASVPVK